MAFDFKKDFPKSAKVSVDPENVNRVVLNNQTYLLSVWLDNGTDTLQIPARNIEELSLTDDFLGFKQFGAISYSTPNFAIERFFNKVADSIPFCDPVADQTSDDEINKGQFTFKGTGSEMVHLKFMRIPSDDNEILDPEADNLIMQSYIITDVKDTGNSLTGKGYDIRFEGIEKYVLENYRIEEYICGNASRDVGGFLLGRLPEYPPAGVGYNKRLRFRADKTGEAIYYLMIRAYKNWSDEVGLTHSLTNMLPPINLELKSTSFEVTPFLRENFPDIDNNIGVVDNVNARNYLTSQTPPFVDPPVGGLFNPLSTAVNVSQSIADQVDETSVFEYVLDRGSLPKKLLVYRADRVADIIFEKPNTYYWDFGSETSFLYTQFDKNTPTWDVVNRFMNFHTSAYTSNASFNDLQTDNKVENISKFDPCILRLDRPANEDVMPLISYRPLATYFNDVVYNNNNTQYVGDGFMGTFVFDTPEGFGTPLEVIPRFLEPAFCIPSKSETPIQDFSFDPAKPSDANLMFKSFVVEYIGGSKIYTNGLDGRLDLVKEYIGQNYVGPIYEYDPQTVRNLGHLVNISDNNLKGGENAQIVQFNNPPTKSATVAMGRNKAIMAYMFFNDSLTFAKEGQITRKAGMTFYASTPEQNREDKIANKMFGFYFCNSITHIIKPKDKSFVQNISGIKFYRRPTTDDARLDSDVLDSQINPFGTPEGFV